MREPGLEHLDGTDGKGPECRAKVLNVIPSRHRRTLRQEGWREDLLISSDPVAVRED